jgi:hypothetical protein
LYHGRGGGLASSTIFTCLYLNKYLTQVPKATPLDDFSTHASESYAASHLLSQLHKCFQARELKRRILVSKLIQKFILNLKSSRSKNTTDFTHRYLVDAVHTTPTSDLHGLMQFSFHLHFQPSTAANSNTSLSLLICWHSSLCYS